MKQMFASSPFWAAAALLLAAAAPLAQAQEADQEPAAEAAEEQPALRRPENPPVEKGLAFVNLARIFKESKHIAARREQISAEFTAREQAISDKIDALQVARQTLDQERLTLTNAQIQEENDRINASEVEIQRETRDLADDKRLRFDAAQRELERAVLETIKEVSRGRENFIVFDLSTILFADARLEITDDVIELLDEKMAAAETPAE
ncbi:MAG: OmpH family outer membrane protein [Betaproteobacteria bacterium AqS2]|uniref:OmpH family outer membrane protein n=1 Tax=Candidatus Amphirhobacter heronislandensis TaxID=1732024 RepID=A0A930UGT8_9GAMM|nr:OmpH family outer membrane protein [Betaproteobacteria bacterium AqS2]